MKNFITLIEIILIITIVFLAYFIGLNLIKITNKAILNYKAEAYRKAHEVQESELLYEDYLSRLNADPELIFNGKIYYNIYGKKAYETDTSIDLSGVQIDENLTKNLMMLPYLNEVILYNQNFTNVEKLNLKNDFPNLTFKWTINILDEEVDYSIESLDLSNKRVNDIDELQRAITLLPNLKSLDFSHTNLSNEELGYLRTEFPNIKIDWVIHIGKWSLRTDSIAFSVLVYRFDYRRVTSDDIQVLKYCTDLQALDLGHQAIEDITVIGDYLPNLRVLILADNKIKDISPIANLKHLHYLELFMNDITDVTPLANCKEMVDLNISFNYRFSNIDGILEYPLLERLWLISDRIPESSYRKIKEVYPNVKLIRTGNGSTGSGWRTHERYYAMIDMYYNNYISESFTKYDNLVIKE